MYRILLATTLASLGFVGSLTSPGAVVAQEVPAPTPVPIEEWSQAKVIAMGREIFIQDTAAWVATDALTGGLTPDQVATVRGWIVNGEGPNRTVRFLIQGTEGLQAGWDVEVVDGQAGPLQPAENPDLSDTERAAVQARQTAGANAGPLRCGPRANSVVARDPDGDGWLVWLLAAKSDNATIPIGGHYRFQISADGETLIRRDQLSNTCLNMSLTPPPGPGGQPGAMVVSQIVSRGPVETHVFLSLQNRLPIYVMADGKLFGVTGDRIREVNMNR